MFYHHCFQHINFYFNVHNFIFHLIFVSIQTHHGNFLIFFNFIFEENIENIYCKIYRALTNQIKCNQWFIIQIVIDWFKSIPNKSIVYKIWYCWIFIVWTPPPPPPLFLKGGSKFWLPPPEGGGEGGIWKIKKKWGRSMCRDRSS